MNTEAQAKELSLALQLTVGQSPWYGMVVVMPASVLLGPLQKLLEYFQRDRHFRTKQKDDALAALQLALTKTLEYLERSNGEKGFDREVEFELSQAWSDAALRIRHVSRELAQRLAVKAEYWADRLDWSLDEVVERRIQLGEIREELNQLIAET